MSPLSLSAYAIRGIATATVLVVLAWVGWKAYAWAYDNGHNAANAHAEKVIGEFMAAEARAQRDARRAEQEKQAAVDKLDAEYQRGLDDAKFAQRHVVSELRADNLRLQDHWRGCETDRLSGSAESARKLDEAAERRAEAAGSIVRVGAECDARDRAWRQYAEAVSK